MQSPPVYSAYIFFASSMSYQQALEIVTSLGLKTFADCQWTAWFLSDNKTFFANDHEMSVLATVNSAPLWLERLKATPGTQMVQPGGVHSCPAMRPTNGPAFLPASQTNTYVQVPFVNTARYTVALDAVNGLGFRLAAPCYEQSQKFCTSFARFTAHLIDKIWSKAAHFIRKFTRIKKKAYFRLVR